MQTFDRITVEKGMKNGRPCIRGLPLTVGTIVSLAERGVSDDEIIALHPRLEKEDIAQALAYAATVRG